MKVKNIHLLLLLACLWGPSFLFIKIAVGEVPPIMLAALRIALAALILNLLLFLKKERLPLSLGYWKKVFIAGLFAQAIPFVLINWGEQYVDSSLASVLNGLMPLFTIIFAHFMISDERLTNNKIFGLLLGFLGLLVLVMPSLLRGANGSFLGILSITVATASYGIGLAYIRKHFSNAQSFKAPAAQLLSVSIYLIPIAFLAYPDFSIWSVSAAGIGSILVLAIFGTAIAFIVYFKLIEQSSAGYASLVTYIMPVFGVVLGVVFLDEPLTFWVLAGAAFILAGIRQTKKPVAKTEKRFGIQIDTALYSKFR